MVDMRDVSQAVAVAAAQHEIHQRAANKAKKELDALLYRAFLDLYHIRNGERIIYDGKPGKAVILRNNTQLGLYIEYDHLRGRYEIPHHQIHLAVTKPKKGKK